MIRHALVLFAALALPAWPDEVDDLLRDLGAEDWSTREQASRRLFEKGPSVRVALGIASASDDAEVAGRADWLVARIDREVAHAGSYVVVRGNLDEYLRAIDRVRRSGLVLPRAFPALPAAVTGRVERVDGDRLRLETAGDVPPRTPFLVLRDGRVIGRAIATEPGGARILPGWTAEPIRTDDEVIDCRLAPGTVVDLFDAASKEVERLRASGMGQVIAMLPPHDGKIVAVHAGVGLVMVNLGQKHGVPAGMNFTVYRGDEYVGQVIVEEVFPDMASARIDSRFAKKDVAEGDDVTTRIR